MVKASQSGAFLNLSINKERQKLSNFYFDSSIIYIFYEFLKVIFRLSFHYVVDLASNSFRNSFVFCSNAKVMRVRSAEIDGTPDFFVVLFS